MPRARIVLSPSTRKLLELVRTGNLRGIEDWTRQGNSLRIPELKPDSSVLSVSVKTGFYSLVELILASCPWKTAEMAYALNVALRNKRIDLVNLLLGAGAPIHEIRFDDACGTMNAQFIERLLDLMLSQAIQAIALRALTVALL